jgi:hypothetical protein
MPGGGPLESATAFSPAAVLWDSMVHRLSFSAQSLQVARCFSTAAFIGGLDSPSIYADRCLANFPHFLFIFSSFLL